MKYIFCIWMLLILLPVISSAHVVVQELARLPVTDVAWEYLKLGYRHILPLGLDHILFVLSLLLLSPKLKPLFLQASIFTVAHSITLALSVYGVIHPSPRIVEPLIALSILFVALENIFASRLKPARILVVFLFGLIHGMGFASVLNESGLPESSYLFGILMFNVGVEFGQLTIILCAYLVLVKGIGSMLDYKKYVVIPVSSVIAVLALYWTIQRAWM